MNLFARNQSALAWQTLAQTPHLLPCITLQCSGSMVKTRWYSLSIIFVDRLAFIKPEVEFIGHFGGAFFRTGSTRRASEHVHVTSLPVDLYLEIADLAGEFSHLAVSQQINVGMPTDIQQLRRENSYRAIIGGKGLIQLGHFARRCWGSFPPDGLGFPCRRDPKRLAFRLFHRR